MRGKDPEAAERAILELAVVDPAAGSGHFLVAAAHRLAKRLAAIRTGEGEPAPSAARRALRDVITHCIYAVDLNPMAVELCKVSLWLEALEPGRPLSFLDAHIKVGNSLLGTTPDLVKDGIPDAAFEAITGDDKAIVRAWRNRNRQERDGQQALFEAPLDIPTEALAREVRSLDVLPEETPDAVAAKAARHAAYVASPDFRRARAALDAWCAAFVAPKTQGAPEITTAVVRAIGTNPTAVRSAILDLVESAAAEYAFFHWPLEFLAVFERGGFDVVVGNPPFLNRLERRSALDRAQAAVLEAQFGSIVRGYADQSAIFLVQASLIARIGGSLGLVQPQSLLSARDAERARAAVVHHARPTFIWTSRVSVFTADVLTMSISMRIGRWTEAVVGRAFGPSFAPASSVEVQFETFSSGQSWALLVGEAFGTQRVEVVNSGTLGSLFECTADFRDQYYGLVPFVEEWAGSGWGDTDHAPLITTGLLDPMWCYWGSRRTKFAKATWNAPVVNLRGLDREPALAAWARRRRVPKILLATQARVLEAWVDESGSSLPSVPVITVTPRAGGDLWLAAALMIAPPVVSWAIGIAGGSALSADAIKLSARQVAEIPLPGDAGAWQLAATCARDAAVVKVEPERLAALEHCALQMARAYDIGEPAELTAWWAGRLKRARAEDAE